MYCSKEKDFVKEYNSGYYRRNIEKIRRRRKQLRRDPVHREKLNKVRRKYYEERCRFLFSFKKLRFDTDKLSSWISAFGRLGYKLSRFAKIIVLEDDKEWLIEDSKRKLGGYRIVKRRTGVRVFTIKKPKIRKPKGPPDDSRLAVVNGKCLFLQSAKQLEATVEKEGGELKRWIDGHRIPHHIDGEGNYWLPEDVLDYALDIWKNLSKVISSQSKLNEVFRTSVKKWFGEHLNA